MSSSTVKRPNYALQNVQDLVKSEFFILYRYLIVRRNYAYVYLSLALLLMVVLPARSEAAALESIDCLKAKPGAWPPVGLLGLVALLYSRRKLKKIMS